MAEIKDNKLRLGAKTTKLVAPALPAKIELSNRSVKPLSKTFTAKNVLSTFSNAKATLLKAAAAQPPQIVPAEAVAPAKSIAASSGGPVVFGAGNLGKAVGKASLFEPLPGAKVLARPAIVAKAIPAAMLKQPVVMKALMPILFRGNLLSFVAGFKEAYDKLTPEQKAKYDAIAKSLGNDAEAKRSLAILLVNGALDTKDLKGGATLLDHLHTIATGPLADGIDRKQLLSNVVNDIANTANIDQGNYNTCAATTAQRLLAGQSPAEYARIMAGLASPSGEVQLANGDTLKRPADWNQSPNDGRDLAGRLFQSSLMSYAAAKGGETYSNATDERTKANGQKKHGLNAAEVVFLFEGILGKDYNKYAKSDIGADALMQKIKDVLAKGGVVPCAITIDGSNHEVLVTKIEDGKVYYYDPQTGDTKSMSEADFKAKLFNANIANPVVLAFRLTAIANMAKFTKGGDDFGPALGPKSWMLDEFGGPKGGPKGGGKTGARAANPSADSSFETSGSKGGKGLFDLGGTAGLLKLLILIGAADEEIGDGSGSGSQTSGSSSGGSSSSTTGGRGRGGKTGSAAGS